MKSGYKLFWSDRALEDLQNIIDYLTETWTQREIQHFARRLDKRLDLFPTTQGYSRKLLSEKISGDLF